MLAYRHLFHAGGFSDVFKHALLARLMLHLNKKDKPYLYLDTHAGIGLYDLQHDWPQKTREFESGITKVLSAQHAPDELADYLRCVGALNAPGALRYYPGSPVLARRFLREDDRIVLSELGREDCGSLGRHFDGDRQVHVHNMDGYQALKAFLPPLERRGLVLIDSSFDRAEEFKRLAEGLTEAHGRWATGIFALWYPLMVAQDMERFERRLAATGIRKILRLELSLFPAWWSGSLRGCAMLVVNPPWGFDADAKKILPWVWAALATDKQGGWDVRWLVPE
ncbi:MAG: 23S rRNA (adenine(2030)-N(6))-methyltransferase RlmJ [Burkholderiales bacterium]